MIPRLLVEAACFPTTAVVVAMGVHSGLVLAEKHGALVEVVDAIDAREVGMRAMVVASDVWAVAMG